MEVDDFPPIDPNVDYEKILPIHQKRILAFINHFITNTVSFLNTFAQSCESRLMEFEYKMQKVEAALLILESQLSSIPSLSSTESSTTTLESKAEEPKDTDVSLDLPDVLITSEDKKNESSVANQENIAGPKASEDPRFIRFFKMLQFGVPVPAVKHKMVVEGFDPNVLDKPNDVVPGYIVEAKLASSSSSSSSS